MHAEVDYFARTTPWTAQWYNCFLFQDPKDWPVLIVDNSDRLVTAVFVDGIKITAATSQRTNKASALQVRTEAVEED